MLVSSRAAQQSEGLSPAFPCKEPHTSPLHAGPECCSTGRGMLAGSGSGGPADGRCLRAVQEARRGAERQADRGCRSCSGWGTGALLLPDRVNTYDFQLAVASSLIRFGDNGN